MAKPHIDDFKGKRVHFAGIGGCSMNGLARMLKSKGYEVSGSDRVESVFTERLAGAGIDVQIGQREENVLGKDLLVYSAAIKPDNPERAAAVKLNIPELERSVLLGQISAQYDDVVCIAGCHGKTTITSMIALVLQRSKTDATVHVGAHADFLDGGTLLGTSGPLVTEACEYVKSFLELSPTRILINNIDDDHLDCYRNIEHIEATFLEFINKLPEDGRLYICADDERSKRVAEQSGRQYTTYGLNGADYTAGAVSANEFGHVSFDCIINRRKRARVELGVVGIHNVQNALAAITVLDALGVELGAIAEGLAEYRLTKRRFEYYGERNGVRVFHDYAHHPSEIRACLQGANMTPHKRIFAVFQCNSYTRAKTLFLEPGDCFSGAFKILVPDIYPGREVDKGEVHAKDMVRGINESGANAKYISTFEEIKQYLDENARPGDIVVTLGSGDVNIRSRIFVE